VVTVLFGGDEGGPDVGVVTVEVPVGAAMPEHDHGGSDIVLVGLAGGVEITGGGTTVAVGTGDAVLIRKDERVALSNPGSQPARVLVAAAPVDFVAGVRRWPDAPAAT